MSRKIQEVVFTWDTPEHARDSLHVAPLSVLRERFGAWIVVRGSRESKQWDLAPIEWLTESMLWRRCCTITSVTQLSNDDQHHLLQLCKAWHALGTMDWLSARRVAMHPQQQQVSQQPSTDEKRQKAKHQQKHQKHPDDHTLLICTTQHSDDTALTQFCSLLRQEQYPFMLWCISLSSMMQTATLDVERCQLLLSQLKASFASKRQQYLHNQAICRQLYPDMVNLHYALDVPYHSHVMTIEPNIDNTSPNKVSHPKASKDISIYSWQDLNARIAAWARYSSERFRAAWPVPEWWNQSWSTEWLQGLQTLIQQCANLQTKWTYTGTQKAKPGATYTRTIDFCSSIVHQLLVSTYGPYLLKQLGHWCPDDITIPHSIMSQALVHLVHIELEQYARERLSWRPTLDTTPFILSLPQLIQLSHFAKHAMYAPQTDQAFLHPRIVASDEVAVQRLVAYAGSDYIRHLDLSCSFVTGSALSVALAQTPVELECESLEQYLAIYYPVVLTPLVRTLYQKPPIAHLLRNRKGAAPTEKMNDFEDVKHTLHYCVRRHDPHDEAKDNENNMSAKQKEEHRKRQQERTLAHREHVRLEPVHVTTDTSIQSSSSHPWHLTLQTVAHRKLEPIAVVERVEYGSDVDIAVDVETWSEFDRVCEQHLKTIQRFIPQAYMIRIYKSGVQTHISSNDGTNTKPLIQMNDSTLAAAAASTATTAAVASAAASVNQQQQSFPPVQPRSADIEQKPQQAPHVQEAYTYQIRNTHESDLLKANETWREQNKRVMRPIELYRTGMARIAAHHMPPVRAAWTASRQTIGHNTSGRNQFVMTASCAFSFWTGRLHTIHYLVSRKHEPVDMLMKWLVRGYRLKSNVDIPKTLYNAMDHTGVMGDRYSNAMGKPIDYDTRLPNQFIKRSSWMYRVSGEGHAKDIPMIADTIVTRLPILNRCGCGNVLAIEHERNLARRIGIRVVPIAYQKKEIAKSSTKSTTPTRTYKMSSSTSTSTWRSRQQQHEKEEEEEEVKNEDQKQERDHKESGEDNEDEVPQPVSERKAPSSDHEREAHEDEEEKDGNGNGNGNGDVDEDEDEDEDEDDEDEEEASGVEDEEEQPVGLTPEQARKRRLRQARIARHEREEERRDNYEAPMPEGDEEGDNDGVIDADELD